MSGSEQLAGYPSVGKVVERSASGDQHLRPVDGERGQIIGNSGVGAEPVTGWLHPAVSRGLAFSSLLCRAIQRRLKFLLAEPRATVSEAPPGEIEVQLARPVR